MVECQSERLALGEGGRGRGWVRFAGGVLSLG